MTRRHNDDLAPRDPRNALELYIKTAQQAKSQATIYSHNSRLSHFVRWCEQEVDEEPRFTNMNNLRGRDLHDYRLWRRVDGDLNTVSEKTQMDTLRVFIRFCETIDAVIPNLSEQVVSPSLNNGENTSDDTLDADVAARILDWLETYRYATPPHVSLVLMWRALLRRGSVRALDVEDYQRDENGEPYLQIRHRPETDTPLKNKGDGERSVALRDDTAALLDDLLSHADRHDVQDDYGRQPLITSEYGRPHQMTYSKWIWSVTRPCLVTNECPEGREINDCSAAAERMKASSCPVSLGPHAVRRGAITHWLTNDVPDTVVSDRANVSPAVIDEHYDQRDEFTKMQQRRRYLDRFE